ncbi:MAG TPA: D-tyrosyl-tRNA(Tyr) deacylase [Candidatus Aphodocola excrementigallinarum]|uniref:D-aminoacyl-tRNA deacylase n=1 Tax=Candidatus Aphodocola excrementigallinarum TaxID=2840670 RepID=A0A9D1IQI3_9FIRM|nr:D-tyrosyl-tRNA(Tyr) deacylase [Candidatus Aphodocola excrementigallinarum]
MRVIVQRSKKSNVKVEGKITGKIDNGLVLLTAFTNGDDKTIVDKMVNKIVNLRIFSDSNDKLNLSLKDVKGSILSISQFTLYAKLNGRRPSFTDSLNYNEAKDLYDYFNEKLKEENVKVEEGIFGADMLVSIENDGPVTIIIDSSDF